MISSVRSVSLSFARSLAHALALALALALVLALALAFWRANRCCLGRISTWSRGCAKRWSLATSFRKSVSLLLSFFHSFNRSLCPFSLPASLPASLSAFRPAQLPFFLFFNHVLSPPSFAGRCRYLEKNHICMCVCVRVCIDICIYRYMYICIDR